ncbi:Ppx/GppA family phosphatase [Erythrobacter sp. SCSIO 43205]|uniref:Ppx/GppA family phosphatase n=1 Tax=Erythrobacter sp. SCSIO 43205 TaxID=2779361 RepID=UPI001CA80952|nr:Ppx/GppA family phosphatase [Erythrobacter sp. SCSIO 43205]UAB77971.1 Ppx/GppA family phosphatase [Erythrobacter sp. SCSIO 43205]
MSSAKVRGRLDGTLSGNKPGRAIIDIGSNTVRMVIYGGSMRAPTVLLNEKVTAKLGRDIASKGVLADEAIALALRGLRRFALLLDNLKVKDVSTVATAAVREASNGPEFIKQLKAIGFKPKIITGEKEGFLSAQGVLGAFPGARGMVADLGGGSLELVRLSEDGPSNAVSLPLGTLRLAELRGESRGEMRKTLEKILKKGAPDVAKGEPLYLVGGTLRTMAVYAMQEQGHPLSDPHGFELSAKEAKKLLGKALANETVESLASRERISSMRAEKLPDTSVLAEAMLARFAPSKIVFSSWGLREGLLYDGLADHSKSLDPLLAGVSVFAAQRGAPATLATRIASWTVDAAPSRKHGSERLRMAAIMLSLASMQIEPNIRLPIALDWALHKRWIAVEGKDRAMLAAAIAANGNALNLPEEVTALAGKEALDEAIVWGFAVRLARRLGASSRHSFQESRLTIEGDRLVLRLAESQGALFGYSTEKDLKLLADQLGLEWEAKIVPGDIL